MIKRYIKKLITKKKLKMYSKLAQKYGTQIEALNSVTPAPRTLISDENWIEIDTNYLSDIDDYCPFYMATSLYIDNPIKIEKCRLLDGFVSVQEAFLHATITGSYKYFEFLLDLLGSKCFEFGDDEYIKAKYKHALISKKCNQYSLIFKYLIERNNHHMLRLVLDCMLKNHKLSLLNEDYIIDIHDRTYRHSYITEAINNASIDCLKLLIEYGCDTQVGDSNDCHVWLLFFQNFKKYSRFDDLQFYNLLRCLLILLKNTLNLPSNFVIETYFKEFLINSNCESNRLVSNIVNYINYLIKSNEFHSLKHYARNSLRSSRIKANLTQSNVNNIVIFSDEKQFFI